MHYSPLDDKNRTQGVRACLSEADPGWVDGKTGEIKGIRIPCYAERLCHSLRTAIPHVEWRSEVGAEGAEGHNWPILARVAESDVDGWERYEMSVPEFLFRVLTDVEFRPFALAPYFPNPTFTSAA